MTIPRPVSASVADFPSEASDASTLSVYCIIPSYRAASTVVDVVEQALQYSDGVIVVDDACPEASGAVVRAAFAGVSKVEVIQRERNGGVGAAVKSGIEVALQRGADVIVKLDADGQMNPAFIPDICDLFIEDPSVGLVKGNRFFDADVIRSMPKMRLFGNAALSLFIKSASGYWNTIDPTNGYLAFNARVLEAMHWKAFSDTYFFEMSVLCAYGLKRLPIVELEMPTVYNDERSSLNPFRVAFEFPPKLFRAALRRLLIQYFVLDINLGTLYCLLGSLLASLGLAFGAYEWGVTFETHVPRTTGTVMLAVLPLLMGFQLLLNALMYDVQFSTRTRHEVKVAVARRRSNSAKRPRAK
ncbi:MAG TPA: glycosyltransferase family 2 protein [Candidatus Baltobacteraceae bacterium]|nr:glycosyltransferase family 2 protein [Candidatus Baltobacteraceae bacterium]